MIDFEIGIQKSLKLNFPKALISGYFFHYVKYLWEKAKKLYLCKKDKIKHTKILIFALKIIYHPKNSYLIYKYKILLKSIYLKIKDSLIKEIEVKKEKKFIIIDNIIKFISDYNYKYKTNLNIHNIIQGDSEEINNINNVCDYLLNLFYGLEKEELENNFNIDENNNQISNDFNENEDLVESLKENSDQSSSDENDNIVYNSDEFEPKPKRKYADKKRNYNDVSGNDNELKKLMIHYY